MYVGLFGVAAQLAVQLPDHGAQGPQATAVPPSPDPFQQALLGQHPGIVDRQFVQHCIPGLFHTPRLTKPPYSHWASRSSSRVRSCWTVSSRRRSIALAQRRTAGLLCRSNSRIGVS